MATDYASLKTQVATWLSRSDQTSNIPDFIGAGLQRINYDLAIAGNIADQETNTTDSTVANQEYLALLTGFRRFTYIFSGTTPNRQTMSSTTYDELLELYGDTTGQPERYAIVGNRFYMRPIPDVVYTIAYGYMKDYVALSADGDTNILITNGSNILLYASLLEAEGQIQDDPRIPIWNTHYKEALRLLLGAERRLRKGQKPAGLRMEPVLTQSTRTWTITQGP